MSFAQKILPHIAHTYTHTHTHTHTHTNKHTHTHRYFQVDLEAYLEVSYH